MFVKLVEIIIYKLHKVNMKQRTFIMIFKTGRWMLWAGQFSIQIWCFTQVSNAASSGTCQKPMAVGGDPDRHGSPLTANYIAKRAGVKTGMALWQARQVCPEIIFVPPRMDLYLRFSRMAQEIYSEYTDQKRTIWDWWKLAGCNCRVLLSRETEWKLQKRSAVGLNMNWALP